MQVSLAGLVVHGTKAFHRSVSNELFQFVCRMVQILETLFNRGNRPSVC